MICYEGETVEILLFPLGILLHWRDMWYNRPPGHFSEHVGDADVFELKGIATELTCQKRMDVDWQAYKIVLGSCWSLGLGNQQDYSFPLAGRLNDGEMHSSSANINQRPRKTLHHPLAQLLLHPKVLFLMIFWQ